MSDKPILSLKLNEQLNGFRKSMDEFAESCIKIVEKYGLSSDETECEQPDTDTISRPQWIPVTERMPETNKDVLLTSWNGNSQYVGWLDDLGTWHSEDEEVIKGYEPIAWMPLPEPYHRP